VTVWPGDADQVQFVRDVLRLHDAESLLGAANSAAVEGHSHLRRGYYEKFAMTRSGHAATVDGSAAEVMLRTLRIWPSAVFLCCGPLGNLRALLQLGDAFRIERVVVQGGFAGTRCVSQPLTKFAGLTHCATWNFGGCVEGALAMLGDARIGRKVLVSKDVCHAALLTEELLGLIRKAPHLARVLEWAEQDYPKRAQRGQLKALHDPLAACVMLDESVVELMEVQVERGPKGTWGSLPAPGTGVFISVALHKEKFFHVFCAPN
jgi:inosine-uridine nucleoside N-ribohydrolase